MLQPSPTTSPVTVDVPHDLEREGGFGPRQALNSQEGCLHCRTALPAGSTQSFCCVGCETVYGALSDGQLLDFYAYRVGAAQPVGDLHLERRSYRWISRDLPKVTSDSGVVNLQFGVQGLHCVACVWAIEQIFYRQAGALGIVVNSGEGVLGLSVESPFDVTRFAVEVERLGYLLAEATDLPEQAMSSTDTLLLRASIVTVLAVFAMMFSLAIYLGLSAGPVFEFLHSANFALSTLAVLIGSPVFVRSALYSLRSRVLHMDLPVALGITLTFLAALWSFMSGVERAAYYDSLTVFIALMLWGRYLQERVVSQNRSRLLEHRPDAGLVTRRLSDDGVQDIPSSEIDRGDMLLVAPGDLVPVNGRVRGTGGSFSLDWISGEPEPSEFEQGDHVSAGAVNVGQSSVRVRALEDYESSRVKRLLSTPRIRAHDNAVGTGVRFAPYYVVGILVAAAVGFFRAYFAEGDMSAGLEIATAVCVVSCPCSIGLALPLASDLVLSQLRQLGLFVRSNSFLARAAKVDTVVFDKTGTLTTGHLELSNVETVSRLSTEHRAVLKQMVIESRHPNAVAILRALAAEPQLQALGRHSVHVREVAGFGVELLWQGRMFRLGRASWACPEATLDEPIGATMLSVDGHPLACFTMREVQRFSLGHDVGKLQSDGYHVQILSGDESCRVRQIAGEVGVAPEHTHSSQTPQQKASMFEAPDMQRALMLGDGINDNLALEAAFVSGTPSLDRPAVTTRADFYFVTPGIAPVLASLRAAKDLLVVRRRSWVFFCIYNLVAVTASIVGAVQPWVAAVLMPTSSVLSMGFVSLSLRHRSRKWMS